MSAAERLREVLAEQRRQGVAFERAWERARVRAVAGATPATRKDWRVAFEATRDAWSASYHGARAAHLDTLRDLRYRQDLVA